MLSGSAQTRMTPGLAMLGRSPWASAVEVAAPKQPMRKTERRRVDRVFVMVI
jgi:hypothetical protein